MYHIEAVALSVCTYANMYLSESHIKVHFQVTVGQNKPQREEAESSLKEKKQNPITGHLECEEKKVTLKKFISHKCEKFTREPTNYYSQK